MMSMVCGIWFRARVITCVSSQSERFFTSGCSSAAFLPANACMMSARLLILLLAGICASVLSFSGGYSLMRISVSMMNLLVNMIQSYEIIWRDRKNALPLQHKRKVSGCSAVGSAHVWGARGRKFESCHPDLKRAEFHKEFSPRFICSAQELSRFSRNMSNGCQRFSSVSSMNPIPMLFSTSRFNGQAHGNAYERTFLISSFCGDEMLSNCRRWVAK